MYGLLDGVTVIELSSWLLLPSAGVILADWGASVVKVESLQGGDPMRGLAQPGGGSSAAPLPMFEVGNRGKQSIGLDVSSPRGRELLYELIEGADVFTTNLLPKVRQKLKIDVDDIQAVKPSIVYARASGYGPLGPEASRPGFDLAAAWASGGASYAMTRPDATEPSFQAASFGDLTGALAAAGAITAALFRRERTGEGSVVDVSLLATGMWMMGPAITAAAFGLPAYSPDRLVPVNPLVNGYRTADGRWLFLCMMQSDPYWEDFCTHVDKRELVHDERFKDSAQRAANAVALREILDEVFATKSLDQWRQRFTTLRGVWAPALSPAEILDEEQPRINGYLPPLQHAGGEYRIIATPAQFDNAPLGPVQPSPQYGQHTEETLLGLGYSWEQISELKQQGVIL